MTRSVRLLFLVIFAVSMFTAHAEKFVAQETLPADYDRLQDWYSSVVRIEITKGAAAGTNAAPPEVEYKIIESSLQNPHTPHKPKEFTQIPHTGIPQELK